MVRNKGESTRNSLEKTTEKVLGLEVTDFLQSPGKSRLKQNSVVKYEDLCDFISLFKTMFRKKKRNFTKVVL